MQLGLIELIVIKIIYKLKYCMIYCGGVKDSIQFKRLEKADLPGGCAWWGGVRDV